MTQDEIDIMWQQAMQESIKDGEMFTRYHFAKLVTERALAEHAMREVQRLGQEIEQDADSFCDSNCVWTDHHPDCKLAQPEQEPLAHWSDCAVHSEPAYPKSECDCGGIVAVADYTALSDKYVALSDKYVALSDKYVALKAQHKEQEPVAWLLTDKNINSIQVDSIQRLINRLNHAHHTDIRVRINGQDEWFEADWLKHMVRATPPQRTWVGLTEQEALDCFSPNPVTHSKNVEAKLKQKNGYAEEKNT
jgi:hypothetical protein